MCVMYPPGTVLEPPLRNRPGQRCVRSGRCGRCGAAVCAEQASNKGQREPAAVLPCTLTGLLQKFQIDRLTLALVMRS